MMYSGVSTGYGGSSDIMYPMRDKRQQKGKRIEAFNCGGGITDTGSRKGIVQQFQHIWQAGQKVKGDKTTVKYLLSFSKKELDPDDPKSVETAMHIGTAVANNLCKNRQWILVVQKDGHAGMVHVHIISNHLSNSLKAAHGRETDYKIVRKVADRMLEKFNIEIDYGENHKKRDEKNQRNKEYYKEKKGDYSWKNEMEKTIDEVISRCTKKSDLRPMLSAKGIGVKEVKKGGWSFVREQSEDGKYIGKECSYDKFSIDFSHKAINKRIDENYNKEVEKRRQEKRRKEQDEQRRRIARRVAELQQELRMDETEEKYEGYGEE